MRHSGRSTGTRKALTVQATGLGSEEWPEATGPKKGSWWTDRVFWLAGKSTSGRVPPPAMGAPDKGYTLLDNAPGTYVFQK